MDIKDYIISLIDRFLKNPVFNNEDKNLAYYSGVLDEILVNNDYIYDFIIGINSDALSYLIDYDNDLNSDDFYNKFNSLKEKIVASKNSKGKIKYTENEIQFTNLFIQLIRNKVYQNEDVVSACSLFKAKLMGNIELDEVDYDLAERLIYLYEKDDADKIFDDVMDYLNRYNIALIRKYGKEEKKKTVYKKALEIKEEASEKEGVNPFEMVNFKYVPKERTRVNKKRKFASENDELNVDALFNKYKIDFNLINELYQNKLKSKFNYNKYDSFINYLAQNGFDYLVSINYIKNLTILLCDSEENKFKEILGTLKDKYKINDEMINRICKMYTRVFAGENFSNFEGNIRILRECGYVDYNDVILNNISFFYDDFNNNIIKLEKLISLGIDGKSVLRDSLNLFVNNFDLIIRNVNILDNYGFDLRDEKDFKSFSILGMKSLSTVLDMFVEMGYSEFIHDNPELTVRNIKSLIIKRILFSYKNRVSIWDNSSMVVKKKMNLSYERKLINMKILGEKEISDLIYNYPILGYFQNGLRVNSFDESYFGLIKRKTELVLKGKIFSRIKVYSVFNALVRKGISIKDATLYAFTYNMDLTSDEYEEIKSYVYNMVGEDALW